MMSDRLWNKIRVQKNTKYPLIQYDAEYVWCVQNAVEALAVLEPAEWAKYNK